MALSALIVWLTLPEPTDEAFEVALVGFATVGALVAARQPRNALGWMLLAFALVLALQTAADVYASTESYPGYLAAAWFATWVWYVWVLLILVFVPLVFPDGHLLSRRWRPVAWLGGAAMVASIVGAAFKPGELDVSAVITNPLAVSGGAGDVFATLESTGTVLLALAVLLTAGSLIVRFRRSRGVERQQLKWFAFAGLLVLGGWTLAAVDALVESAWSEPVGSVGWTMFMLASILGIPGATGIAIFRYRLYDIDLVINRTLVYGVLTVALVTTYVGSVLVLRLVLSPITGDSALAVAGSTLAVAALFRPARRRIQDVVDRRFYRRRYDAARILDEFANRLRHELDLDAVGADLCAATVATLQPTHVSLWVRP
ncbi:MAG: hypothetical protein ACRDPJ_20310 [Nocardioidaceae bacterium]